LTEVEVNQWQQAAENMFLPFDEKKQIFAQDDSFLDKPKWDFTNTPKDKYPLLLHLHPLVIYRHQVLKQADTLLALLLAPDEIDPSLKRNCFDYYEPINTHDSTLSTCVHGVIANEVGYTDKAYEYYQTTLHLDLDDSHHNTYYGVHTAAMGGIWMGAIQGFAGLRYANGELSFRPALPSQWQSLTFRLRYRNRVIEVCLNADGSHFTVLKGEPITLRCHDKAFLVSSERTLTVSL
jgi:alpha,alpha-trehalose phosphorylase